MNRFGFDLRSRRAMLGLTSAALLVSLVLAGALLASPQSPAERNLVAGATAAAATATAEKVRQPSPSPAASATATEDPTPGPAATSPVVPFETRVAGATAGARGEEEATPVPPTLTAGDRPATATMGSAEPTGTERYATPTTQPTPAFVLVELLPSPTPTPIFPQQLVGKIVFLSNMNRTQTRVYAIDPDGLGLAQLTADWPLPRAAEADALSPDGFYRAFVGRNLETGQTRLEVRKAATDEAVAVIASGPIFAPAWSPVSDQVLFVSTEGGNENIWLVGADGRGKKQLTANKWPADQHPSWSPDGTQIVFTSNRNGKRQVWIMNADGSDQRLLTGEDYEAWDPVWVKYD